MSREGLLPRGENTKDNLVRCRCGEIDAEAYYEVEGRYLTLHSPFGVIKVALGLQMPRRLASKLFKNVCVKATADRQNAVPPETPTPDVIDAVETASQGSRLRVAISGT